MNLYNATDFNETFADNIKVNGWLMVVHLFSHHHYFTEIFFSPTMQF